MGIHSGPVSEITDVSGRTNITGGGINVAQRVMDCGDAGHILVSKHVANDLQEHRQWASWLHDLGECEVKHGMRVSIVNLHADQVGNPQLPKKFQALKKRRARMHLAAVTAALLALAIALVVVSKKFARSTSTVSEKSIAVLPFENLSRDPDNAYFADGIQEEILTRLSRIADLKVISRTSTQRYKTAPNNLSEIAKQLGVANILEGTVQKAADQVRVNVQLINAENDSHLWADKYDRKLADIFAVESEVATKIAETLQAKLTGAEQHAIVARPTENSEAYQLYLKGRYFGNKLTPDGFQKAIEYFQQAIEKDPAYALAYAGLADSYEMLGFWGVLPPQEMWPKAKAAALKALELDNNLAEAQVALGWVSFTYDWDWAG